MRISEINKKPPSAKPSLARRLGWLVLIWLASVAALGVVSLLFKLMMRAAGFNT